MVGEWREHLAQLHRLSLALGPPFLAVEAIAGEQHSQPDWRFAGDFTATRDIAPHVKRLQPRERHGNTEAAKHRAAREFMISHVGSPSNGSPRPVFRGRERSHSSFVKCGFDTSNLTELSAFHYGCERHAHLEVLRSQFVLHLG